MDFGGNNGKPMNYRSLMSDFHGSMESENYAPSTGEELNVSVKDIGMSGPMGISAANVSGIYSKIRMGAGSLEIGFPGAFSGNRQAQTPGMYGEDQRQAIRELAKVNEIKLTTHAAYNIMGMMGRDPRDNFSTNQAADCSKEIQRAIDFAADTAGGGSVVVHSGEWDRPITDIYVDDPLMEMNHNLAYDEDGRMRFKRKQHEYADAMFVLLDDRTSQKMETVHKDRKVAVPVWKRATKDNPETSKLIGTWSKYQDNIHVTEEDKEKYGWMEDMMGKRVQVKEGDYIDYEGNVIINPYDPKFGRVPEFDEKSNRFKVAYMDFDDFRKEAKEQTQWNKDHWKKMHKQDWHNDNMWYYGGLVYPDEAFLHATLETNEGHSRGWALQYAERMGTHQKAIEKLHEIRGHYEEIKKDLPEDEQWKIAMTDSELQRYTDGIIPPETRDPLEMIDKLINQQRVNLEFARQASASQQQQAEDTAETKRHIVTPFKRFKLHGARMYAEAAVRALRRTKDEKNPLFLAIENIFPERFGGHPQELKFVIDESRKWFVDLLTEKQIKHGNPTRDTPLEDTRGVSENPWYMGKMDKKQAEELAKKHIRATIDTGHMNLWRKYWQPKQGQNIEQSEKEFKQWYLKEFKSLVKGGYVGNIHLTDNYGFQDDHIAPGQGNAPIREVMRILKENGYDEAITTEPGADASTDLSDFHGLMKTWRYLGNTVYGTGLGGGGGGGGAPQNWGTLQYSYFGQNKPPYFVFGSYAPSNDWTLWSQVPME